MTIIDAVTLLGSRPRALAHNALAHGHLDHAPEAGSEHFGTACVQSYTPIYRHTHHESEVLCPMLAFRIDECCEVHNGAEARYNRI